jgi:hypothetical protein
MVAYQGITALAAGGQTVSMYPGWPRDYLIGGIEEVRSLAEHPDHCERSQTTKTLIIEDFDD